LLQVVDPEYIEPIAKKLSTEKSRANKATLTTNETKTKITINHLQKYTQGKIAG
jgi:hypothetical protein